MATLIKEKHLIEPCFEFHGHHGREQGDMQVDTVLEK